MALKQIAARTEGDIYQGLFFWREATRLLIPESKVERVEFEHDEATGVDDIVVFYSGLGIKDEGCDIVADFYQIKYHVDSRDSYSCEALIDPNFINAKSSLLQHFCNAYKKLKSKHSDFRLHLVSNWRWKDDDPIGLYIRESNGALPCSFLTDSPSSKMGKIRCSWEKHLGIDHDDFREFCKCIRLQLNHFGRNGFIDNLNDKLARVGLITVPADKQANPYISLYMNLIVNGKNSFDKGAFEEFCRNEDLLVEPLSDSAPVVGIRSFSHSTGHIESETSDYVCLLEFFNERHAKKLEFWKDAIPRKVLDFLNNSLSFQVLRKTEHNLLLECHGSLAFLAGYELHRKSGVKVYPIQKGTNPALWKPMGKSNPAWDWESYPNSLDQGDSEIGFAISITHDITEDVLSFVKKESISIKMLYTLSPKSGIGANSISGADHAISLIDKLIPILRKNRGRNTELVHLWISAPNAFHFFLGQYRDVLGAIQLYEFDLTGESTGSYIPSLKLPIKYLE